MRLLALVLATPALAACASVLGLDDFEDQPSGSGAAGATGASGSSETTASGGAGAASGGGPASGGAGGGPATYAAQAVAAGEAHSCAIVDGGSVVCWGNNDDGQLGDGTFDSSPTPVVVSGITSAVAIDAGARHTCVLIRGGSVLCWGDNESGQIGTAGGGDAGEPVAPDTLPAGIGGVSAGARHSCAFQEGGQAFCWGDNLKGQLGRGNLGGSTAVGPVNMLSVVVSVTAGEGHSCAAADSVTIWCWGDNAHQQVGGPDSVYPDPRVVYFLGSPGPPNAGAPVVAAGDSACNFRGGGPWCWGRNDLGQLGVGSTTDSGQAIDTGLTNVVQIAGGGNHFCARQQNGALLCWGSNDSGQLGDGNSGTIATSPVSVVGLSDAVDVGPGARHTCAVVEAAAAGSAEVHCWGANEAGQLGDGSTDPSSVPVHVQSLP